MKSILIRLSGPLLGAILGYLQFQASESSMQAHMTFLSVWMAIWWITESVSLYLTALLPLICFPLLGIMDMQDTAPLYNQEIIFLFTGGFILAFGLEKHQVHSRIAAFILRFTGNKPSGILLGFMLAAWFISMWISNIATAMMLLPAAMAVMHSTEKIEGMKTFTPALLLGVAYSCSIGGVATIVGTAPNMIFMAFYNDHYPQLPPITFVSWLQYGFPISLSMLLISFFILRQIFIRKTMPDFDMQQHFMQQGLHTQSLQSGAKRVLALFVITVLLWFFRSDIPMGGFVIPGWTRWLPMPEYIKDSTVAIGMAIVMLLWHDREGKALLDWKDVQRLPIGILFLFGGGFALAKGIQISGLSAWLSDQLAGINHLPVFIIILLLATFMTFLTELTSNTASTYLVLPVLFAMCNLMDTQPLFIMFPVVISASFAFMLPVATPPNTVIFATEKISVRTMAFTGLWLNLAGIIIVTLITRLLMG
jgi:solute carrier family 13 (sodium-dependent dicarboxylate transporter), member 2/3/5